MTRGDRETGRRGGKRERDAFSFNGKAERSKEALSAIDPLSQAWNTSPARGTGLTVKCADVLGAQQSGGRVLVRARGPPLTTKQKGRRREEAVIGPISDPFKQEASGLITGTWASRERGV